MRGDISPLDHAVNAPIWHRIAAANIGPQDASLSFAHRLARENGWSADFAARVIEEYRRFCFLAVTSGGEVTPSDAVDQAWHLHLTYSRDYWDHFCPEVLGSDLHHGPTRGGQTERGRFFEQYAQTLKLYEQAFGPAPADIWPAAARRLLDDPRARRVHPRDGLIVSRGKLAALLVVTLLIGLALGWVMFGGNR
ncbi:MAG: glycine-rich domain-containing protein [Novosphingobium sp.]